MPSKMRRLFVWGASTIVVLLFCTGCYLDDPVRKVENWTTFCINRFELTGDASGLAACLEHYDGEGPGYEKMVIFANWSIENRKGFEEFCRKIEGKGDRIADSYGSVLVDMELNKVFLERYHASENKFLKMTIKQVREAEQWQKKR